MFKEPRSDLCDKEQRLHISSSLYGLVGFNYYKRPLVLAKQETPKLTPPKGRNNVTEEHGDFLLSSRTVQHERSGVFEFTSLTKARSTLMAHQSTLASRERPQPWISCGISHGFPVLPDDFFPGYPQNLSCLTAETSLSAEPAHDTEASDQVSFLGQDNMTFPFSPINNPNLRQEGSDHAWIQETTRLRRLSAQETLEGQHSFNVEIDEINPCPTQRSNTASTTRGFSNEKQLQSQYKDEGRKALDDFLIKSKLSGMSYKEIKHKGNFKEAESTLRGRFRNLTKPKKSRVRKPSWSERDVSPRPVFLRV